MEAAITKWVALSNLNMLKKGHAAKVKMAKAAKMNIEMILSREEEEMGAYLVALESFLALRILNNLKSRHLTLASLPYSKLLTQIWIR